MTKLKTLKDLMKPAHCKNYAMLIKAGDLKAEAIKWVKELKSEIHKYRHRVKQQCHCPACRNKRHTIKWVINFFNLTEEDK